MPATALPFDFTCAPEEIRGLAPVALEAASRAAAEYTRLTTARVTVTSAARTLYHTAELMAAFTLAQLEGMYCRHGYPQYIAAMRDAMAAAGRPLTPAETYAILRDRTEGYISSHLYGAALDFATDALTKPALLASLLHSVGFKTLDENSLGIHCLHASHPNVPVRIIKY